MPILLFPLLMAAQAQTCPSPATPEQLADAGRRARDAFVALDSPAFEAAASELETLVPCLDTLITPAQAGEIHLVSALRSFVAQDEPATVAAFQAAAAADPTADPATWLPARHPVLVERRYALRLAESPARELRIPRGTSVWVDGAPAERLVPSRPAVIQQDPAEGGVASALWRPEAPLPEGLAFREPRVPPRVARRLVLGSGAVVAAGAATGLALWSSALREDFRDPDTPYDKLDGLAATNVAASLAAGGSGLVALGLGAALVITW